MAVMKRRRSMLFGLKLVALAGMAAATGCAGSDGKSGEASGAASDGKSEGEMRAAVTFSGGHEIGANDYGRPVVLMAAALGVEPDVFREAFSGVTPARGRGP